jgi:oligopeptide transport system substrate-binding protein
MAHRKPYLYIVSLLLLILSCGTFTGSGSGSIDDLLAAQDIDDENALFLIGGQPRTLDPATTRSGAGSVVGDIFSGLVTLDTALQVQPELAAGWDIGEDGTVYTFYLREDAVFHDGRPVTAADVVFSWERAADPDIASDTVQTYLGDIVGVEDVLAGRSEHISGLRVIDDHILEVRIDAPKAYFLSKLTYPVTYVVDQDNVGRSEWERMPNGTGPFKLQEWQDDEIMVLDRNEDYYGGVADVSQIVYLMGAGIPLSMYEKDEIDLVNVGGSNLERVQDPNNPLFPDLEVGADMCTNYVGLNNQQQPFDDPLVRQAFNYALDRERLIDGIFKGNVLPAVGPLPPGMPGYTGRVDEYAYDPERARELLAEAGYADPESFPVLTYTTSGYGGVGSLATAVITMWQNNLGVTIEPVLLEPFNYLDELYAGNLGHFYTMGWCADYPDPENFLDVLFHSESRHNLGRYANPEVDALLEQARVEPDVRTRLDLYADIERAIVADAPVVFLSHSLSAVLVKPHLQNYVLTPMGVAQWHRVNVSR